MRDFKIKYRTFDQLLDSVMDEFSTYDKNALIEPSHLIKIAKKINKKLNHRITKTKQCIIPIENNVIKLPNDLHTINFMVYMKSYTVFNTNIQGTQTENISIDTDDLNYYPPNKEIYITKNGDMYDVIETKKGYTEYRYKVTARIKILFHEDMFHLKECNVTAEIKGDFARINLPDGFVYINYEGMFEDEQGNLLVLDHDLINDYYEYSLKRRILENVFLNGEETTVQNKIQLIEARWKESRKEALSVANMFDFSEIEDTLKMNREAMYKRYYSIFL